MLLLFLVVHPPLSTCPECVRAIHASQVGGYVALEVVPSQMVLQVRGTDRLPPASMAASRSAAAVTCCCRAPRTSSTPARRQALLACLQYLRCLQALVSLSCVLVVAFISLLHLPSARGPLLLPGLALAWAVLAAFTLLLQVGGGRSTQLLLPSMLRGGGPEGLGKGNMAGGWPLLAQLGMPG